MKNYKQISLLLFLSVLLYLNISCDLDKPNQPIENTIDTIAVGTPDRIVDTTIDTTTIPDNFRIKIERTFGVIQGQDHSIEVKMENAELNNFSMGGFDLLIRYDAYALTFQNAEAGQFITDCGWEYFTYRYSPSAYDSLWIGEVRVVSIAETNNGSGNHPDCFTNNGTVSDQLVLLNFRVTNDRTRECTFAPVEFIWNDCGDNTISSPSGDQLYISNHIYNYIDTNTIDFSNDLANDTLFPTYLGANSTCDTTARAGNPDPLRLVDFVNGGVEIVCADLIDPRGDLNLNEIAYEIADAVLYADYFVYGLNAFSLDTTDNYRRRNGQIATSDINNDGRFLTVADLVYHIRVTIGKANPFPNVPPDTSRIPISPTVTRVIADGTLNVDIEMGAMQIVVKGNATHELLAEDMTVKSVFHRTSNNTHILVYSLESNSFIDDFLKVKGEIVSIEFGSADGFSVLIGP